MHHRGHHPHHHRVAPDFTLALLELHLAAIRPSAASCRSSSACRAIRCAGPLYRPDRTSLANTGQPIHKNQPGDQMDISAPMACTNYSNVGTVHGLLPFDRFRHPRQESTCWSATARHGRRCPMPGRDPLFWVHHANIDRLWAHLEPQRRHEPDDRHLGERNRSRSPTARASASQAVLKDFFDLSTLGYTYDDLLAAGRSRLSAHALHDHGRAPMAQQAPFRRKSRAAPAWPIWAPSRVRVSLLRVPGARATEVMGLATPPMASAPIWCSRTCTRGSSRKCSTTST